MSCKRGTMGAPRPTLPAMPTIPTSPPPREELEATLAEAALVIASFRWRLREAGYPFREPSAVDATITRIDNCLLPLPKRGRPVGSTKQASPT